MRDGDRSVRAKAFSTLAGKLMLLTAADVLLGLARALLPEQPGAALIPVLEGLPHAVLDA